MARIRTLADLNESSAYAWPGGYPVAFYDAQGGVLCYDCVEAELFSEEEMSDANFTYQDAEFDSNVENDDTQYYGGLTCDQCSQYIVEPTCPECGDELYDGSALLHADNVDASLLHRRCAVKLIAGRCAEGSAERIPGVGIKISTAGGVHSPWYAPAGTIYSYR